MKSKLPNFGLKQENTSLITLEQIQEVLDRRVSPDDTNGLEGKLVARRGDTKAFDSVKD